MNIVQSPARKQRKIPMDPHGLMLHQPGRTIVQRAIREGKNPLDVVLERYHATGGPHGLMDYDGTIHQIQPWDRQGAHAKVPAKDRRLYLNGKWADELPPRTVRLWRDKFPSIKSPQHLYPTRKPNQCYIGIEMMPLLKPINGLWFTNLQHQSAREFYLAGRSLWDWPPIHRALGSLVGHEDVSPYSRWLTVKTKRDAGGGWDPGHLRPRPRFDFDRVMLPEPSPLDWVEAYELALKVLGGPSAKPWWFRCWAVR